ncbi:PKD domain-containing protein [Motilibacter deserti]|uniref:PKD domain-containing protein n=1 Tax=Motilibacter deserti TaxID=2714956 RepID=A0ABX0GUA9_9ACTN|nr:PKD domain-containing protein [Motilibacter deserti]NHC13244.1 hypothetical protein [Motilibacter deserti]
MAKTLSRAAALASASAVTAALGVGLAAPAHAIPEASGTSLSAKAGVTFAGALATISSFAGPREGVSALVHWGDGSGMSTGSIAGPAGSPAVFGTHRYAAPGTYTVWVIVFDASGARSVTSTVTVR